MHLEVHTNKKVLKTVKLKVNSVGEFATWGSVYIYCEKNYPEFVNKNI